MVVISFDVLPSDHDQIIDLSKFVSGLGDRRKGELSALLSDMPLGIRISFEKIKKSRSRQQENYYRKWVNEFARWCGMTHDELHEELLCRAYGSEEISTKFGIRRRPLKRSNDTTQSKYGELIDQLIITAAEIGFAVPEPRDGN